MTEKEIEKYFCLAVKSIGGISYKFKSISSRGVADRVVCLPNGKTWFVEIKQAKGKLSMLQEIFAKDMASLNQLYACLWSIDQIDSWITKVKQTL
jgi:hypothetical protein